MTHADRDHAAKLLLAFLGQVGPLEASWALRAALNAIQDLPASADQVAAAAEALTTALDEPQPAVSEGKASRKTAAKPVDGGQP